MSSHATLPPSLYSSLYPSSDICLRFSPSPHRHSPFDENFRFFASSHIHLGFELGVALILFALYTKSKQYGGLTWSLWLTSVSFLLGPFWFNPVTFEWGKCYEDYVVWDRWMSETGVSSYLDIVFK